MSTSLLRVAKRRTSWELETSFEDALRAEFRTKAGEWDLCLSVYEVQPSRHVIIRTHAEHAAGARMDPPRGGALINLARETQQADQSVIAVPNTSPFSFTRNAHREIHFPSTADLQSFAKYIFLDIEQRRHRTGKDELRNYVSDRISSSDPEWVEYCAANPKWASFAKATTRDIDERKCGGDE